MTFALYSFVCSVVFFQSTCYSRLFWKMNENSLWLTLDISLRKLCNLLRVLLFMYEMGNVNLGSMMYAPLY